MDEGGVFDGVENVLHGVCHRQHETGGQLSQRTARIHQRRGIGQEIQLGHHPVKRTGGGRHIGLGIEDGVGCGDRIGDPVEQAVHRFNRLARFVSGQVAPLQHGLGVLRNRHKTLSSEQRIVILYIVSRTKNKSIFCFLL